VEQRFRQYYSDLGTDEEREDWVSASLDETPTFIEATEYLD
jgi:hypothetical protein